MSKKHEELITGDEIKKEFQVERMILFSDAVFAIVITLMAIEIKIPEAQEKLTHENLLHELRHLLPVILAYIVSFFFIGTIWYQHLKIFSLVKDYDKGLVVRNLVLLFLIGLFPFSASLITRSGDSSITFLIYMGIILFCSSAQYVLHDYIVNRRPALRTNVDLSGQLIELKKKRIIIIGFTVVFLLSCISYYLITDEELRGIIPLWILPVVIIYRVMSRKMTSKK